jgi:hypothetical protein
MNNSHGIRKKHALVQLFFESCNKADPINHQRNKRLLEVSILLCKSCLTFQFKMNGRRSTKSYGLRPLSLNSFEDSYWS